MDKKIVKKYMIAGILTVAAAVFSIGSAAFAEEGIPEKSKDTLLLGSSGMATPKVPSGLDAPWEGSYVYYGKHYDYNTSSYGYFRYRVLAPSTDEYTKGKGIKTLFLDSDVLQFYSTFWNSNDYTCNKWEGSYAQYQLNNESRTFRMSNISDSEFRAIADSNRESQKVMGAGSGGPIPEPLVEDYGDINENAIYTVPLKNEKVFMLDIADVFNEAYGYIKCQKKSDNESAICREKLYHGQQRTFWWLLNPRNEKSMYVATVTDYNRGGPISGYAVTTRTGGVSPAFNVDLSKVLFSSLVNGTKGETGAEYKLTIIDDRLTLESPDSTYRLDNEVLIPYKVGGSLSANATQLSILFLDKEYNAADTDDINILGYEKLMDLPRDKAGYATYDFTGKELEDKKWGVDYYSYIIAEDINGGKDTDFASEPVPVRIDEKLSVPFVTLYGIDKPVAGLPFDFDADVDILNSENIIISKPAVSWEKEDTTPVDETTCASINEKYKMTVSVSANGGGVFAEDVVILFTDCDGRIISNKDGVGDIKGNFDMSLDKTYFSISMENISARKRRMYSVSGPGLWTMGVAGDEFKKEFADKDAVLDPLKDLKAMAVLEGAPGQPDEKQEFRVNWTVSYNDVNGVSHDGYNEKSHAWNLFRWTVDETESGEYDTSAVELSGMYNIQNAGSKIKRIGISDFEEPKAGNALASYALVFNAYSSNNPDNSDLSILDDPIMEIKWYRWNDDTYEEAGEFDRAEYGYSYYPFMMLKAADGYVFDENCAVDINEKGLSSDRRYVFEDEIYITPGEYYLDTTKINAVSLNGFEKPVIGKKFQELILAEVSENCIVDDDYRELKWTNEDGTGAEEPEWNKIYKASTSVSVNYGFEFAKDTVVWLDGEELPPEAVTINKAGGYNTDMRVDLGTFRVDTKKITEVSLNGFEKPVIGKKFQKLILAEVSENCIADDYYRELKWTKEDGTGAIEPEWNKIYKASTSVSVNHGFEFAEDTVVWLDGEKLSPEAVTINRAGGYNTDMRLDLGTFGVDTEKIAEVSLNGLKKPVAGEALQKSLKVSVSDNYRTARVTAFLNWTDESDGSTVLDAKWERSYRARATVSVNTGYEFTKDTIVSLDGETLSPSSTGLVKNGDFDSGLLLDLGSYSTVKRRIKRITEPYYPDTFEKEYTADSVLSSNELGRKAVLHFEGNKEPLSVSADVIWSLEGTYDAKSGANNSFYWKIDDEDLPDYDTDDIYTDGYVQILNKGSGKGEDSEDSGDSGDITQVSGNTVSDNKTSVSVNVMGNLYTVRWDKTVSGNGRRHVAVGMKENGTLYKAKNTSSKQCDIGVKIYLNGEFVDPSEYKLTTKNNKKASVSIDGINAIKEDNLPYFKVKFKGKRHKNAKKSFKDKKFEFGITPMLLTPENVTFGEIKQDDNGEVRFKKITFNSNEIGKIVKLKYNSDRNKTDYVIDQSPDSGSISITGKNDYYGTVYYKK